MASRADVMAGRAFVEIYVKDIAKLKKSLQTIGTDFRKLGEGMANVGRQMMVGFGGAFASLAIPVKMAGDLMETTSKFRAVFGSSADDAQKWADTFAETIGRSRSETMTSLAAFQAFATGLGMTGDQAMAFATELHSLSVDFASFHNLADQESMGRFISAMSGSSEVLDQFGINIKQAALDQQLLAMGFPSISAGATEMQKTLARLSVIRQSMGRQGALGDAIRTSGSFANQMKALRSEVKDTAETIGNALLPVITPLVSQARQAAAAFAEWTKQNQGAIVGLAKLLALGTAAGGGIFLAGKGLSGLGVAFQGLALVPMSVLAISAALNPITLAVGAIGVGMGVLAKYFLDLKPIWQSFSTGLIADFKVGWGSIVSAVMSGDLGLAGEIAMAGLGLVWQRGMNALNAMWIEGKFFALETWESFKTTAAEVFVSLWADIQRGWVQTVAFLSRTWLDFYSEFANRWNALQLNVGMQIIEVAEVSGLVSKEFADAWRQSLQIPIEDKIRSRSGALPERQSEINARRAADLGAIAAGETGAYSTLEADRRRALAGLAAAHAGSLGAGEAALAEKRARLAAMAGKAPAAGGRDTFVDSMTEMILGPPLKRPGLAGIGPMSSERGVAVSFSGAALMAMGRGSAQDRMAADIRDHKRIGEKHLTAAEEAVELLSKLVDKPGLVWA